MRTGREARSEFGESLAPEKPDNRHARLEHPVHLAPLPQADAVHAAQVGAQDHQGATASIARSRAGSTATGGSNGAAITTSSRDNERIRFELLSIVMGVWDYIKNSGDFPDSALLGAWTGSA